MTFGTKNRFFSGGGQAPFSTLNPARHLRCFPPPTKILNMPLVMTMSQSVDSSGVLTCLGIEMRDQCNDQDWDSDHQDRDQGNNSQDQEQDCENTVSRSDCLSRLPSLHSSVCYTDCELCNSTDKSHYIRQLYYTLHRCN